MQKREDKEGSRIEKRICESVSNHYPGPTDYISLFDFHDACGLRYKSGLYEYLLCTIANSQLYSASPGRL